jgi:hypothetical protein
VSQVQELKSYDPFLVVPNLVSYTWMSDFGSSTTPVIASSVVLSHRFLPISYFLDHLICFILFYFIYMPSDTTIASALVPTNMLLLVS